MTRTPSEGSFVLMTPAARGRPSTRASFRAVRSRWRSTRAIRITLLATDSGLWRSRNAGRDWDVEAPETLAGPAFAAAFAADGQRALVAGTRPSSATTGTWRPVRAPAGASPACAGSAGAVPGSSTWRAEPGSTGATTGGVLDERRACAKRIVSMRCWRFQGVPSACAVVAGSVWSSNDGARSWQRRSNGNPGNAIEAIGVDPPAPTLSGRWPPGDGHRSDQPGGEWRAVGKPVHETSALARAMAISGAAIVIRLTAAYSEAPTAANDGSLKESLPARGCSAPGRRLAQSRHALRRFRVDRLRKVAAASTARETASWRWAWAASAVSPWSS